MKRRRMHLLFTVLAVAWTDGATAQSEFRNDRYRVGVSNDGVMTMEVAGMAPQLFVPEFTVLWTDADPQCARNASHPNYPVAPRTAVRWRNPDEPIEELNAWVGSPQFKTVTGMKGTVLGSGKGRVWEFRDAQDKVKVRITGDRALDTTRPFSVGQRVLMKPVHSMVDANRVRWEYGPQGEFALAAELALPAGDRDPELSFTLTPRREAFFSVAFTGTPSVSLADTLLVPQECDGRGHKQFDFVVSEADLHLPRVQVATKAGNLALVADPRECRFRLPTIADSRFGLMLQSEGVLLKPVLLAPLLGGPESRMRADAPWRFTFRYVMRAGDWKETYAHIARDIHGFRDERDNSGPGSLNDTLERIVDFLVDRRGGNHALWDPQQKYYDYFNDKTGVFKPFSPLYGLGVAIVTDDEEFFRKRARPAVEYSLSRRSLVFAPYDNADNKQANSAGRTVGEPCVGYAQLATLHALFQEKTPALRALAEARGPTKGKLSDVLARWRLTGDSGVLDEALAMAAKSSARDEAFGEEEFFDLLDLANITRDPRHIASARAAAYQNSAKLSLYPAPPEESVTVDRGGLVPVHEHSYGRHRNQWGFPTPQPLVVKEQTVPAWRIARVGLPGIAYPIEYWMNTHGAMMRTAGLAHDDLLRDVARWGMVGRFGNFPGDNRSKDSLVPELPDAVERGPWGWNFATVNAGHAWDFAGAVLDFLISDGFERSRGAIDFPALSAGGSSFRVGIYGGKPGAFHGDKGVHLWLPRGLITSNNRQFDWLAGYGNGNFYLALWNQSFREEQAKIVVDPALVQCDGGHDGRIWRDQAQDVPCTVANNRIDVTVGPKGIVAFAIPAMVKPRLQGRLYDGGVAPLPAASFANVAAPFGPVHAMLVRAGRGLTSAYVYTEALPEAVIAARLYWRQGDGGWQELNDDIYPYEFSPELRDDAGDFACMLEIEDSRRKRLRSPVISLAMGGAAPRAVVAPPEAPFDDVQPHSVEQKSGAEFDADFVKYIQQAANGHQFGLRTDGRFYPYSTPLGRRIGARQLVWDPALFGGGCTGEDAEQHLRADLSHTRIALIATLATRQPSVEYSRLDPRQQETLLDFAHSEGVAGLRADVVAAVLASDWKRLSGEHLYVRYDGHAPDHARNKAFAQRWNIQ